eukprot:TRINITY_DN51631_c0_g1_i1.p1 TRINITY_DN51631_c0_g1~~TRINITY_DN51631_c0_g1_i1.p1  ORF type:complete len:443 (+),score=60.05 TRINITY_DN51631_c0_g1_i1:77-1330(+)
MRGRERSAAYPRGRLRSPHGRAALTLLAAGPALAAAACPASGCGSRGRCDSAANACVCDSGYTGDACDACAPPLYNYPACDVVCTSSSCQGHGFCDSAGRCECDCVNGGACWAGLNCELCSAHHYGADCATYCDPTISCRGRGQCDGAGACQCDSGLCGADCTECCAADTFNWPTCDVRCSNAETCSGHGRCLRSSGRCECDTGFAQPDCASCSESDRYYGYPECERCPSVPGALERWDGEKCVPLPSPTPAPGTPVPWTPRPAAPPPPPGGTSGGGAVTPAPGSSADADVAWWIIMIAVLAGLLVCAGGAYWRLKTLRKEAATAHPAEQAAELPPGTLTSAMPLASLSPQPAEDDAAPALGVPVVATGIPLSVAPAPDANGPAPQWAGSGGGGGGASADGAAGGGAPLRHPSETEI